MQIPVALIFLFKMIRNWRSDEILEMKIKEMDSSRSTTVNNAHFIEVDEYLGWHNDQSRKTYTAQENMIKRIEELEAKMKKALITHKE